jgi:tartrate-resistant acid phosphatase type 5
MSLRKLSRAVVALGLLCTLAVPAVAADHTGVNLFTVGDWGIDSPDRQAVADAMAKRASVPGNTPDAVLLLGDNFYVKLADVKDHQITDFFEKTYDPVKLNVNFFAVLGNHDYKEKDDAIELAYSAQGNTRFKLPARWYRLEMPAEKPLVTVLMLDSDQPLMSADQWTAELAWLETELAKPHAPWLICCAHHDMFGNGSHGDNGVLMTTWGPLFKKYHVDFYICGHEHTLQHLEVDGWPISFVIAGGGGAKRKGMLRDVRGPFSKASLGFASFHFEPDSTSVQLIDDKSTVLHAFDRTLAGQTTITLTTSSDKATTRPLRVINDLGDKGKGFGD